MSMSLAAVSARLGLLAIGICLTVAACSPSSSTPATATAAPPLTATPAPSTSSSQPIPTPTPSPTTPEIHLPLLYNPTEPAWRDIAGAVRKAAVDGKPVLIDFSSSWCPACQELQHALKSARLQAMERSLHLVQVDTGSRTVGTNLGVAMAYGLDLQKTGIPGLVLLSPSGLVEATTNDGLFDNDQPITASEIISFLKPNL